MLKGMSRLHEKREGRTPLAWVLPRYAGIIAGEAVKAPLILTTPKEPLYALRLVLFHPATMVPGEIPLTLTENTDIIAHFLKIPVFTGKKICSLLCLYEAGDKRG